VVASSAADIAASPDGSNATPAQASPLISRNAFSSASDVGVPRRP
jgi:hypothetical protein